MALVHSELADHTLAKLVMEQDIPDAISSRHVVVQFLAFRLRDAGLPEDGHRILRAGLLPRRPWLLHFRGIAELVGTVAGLAFHLDNGLTLHGHDRMVKINLAFRAVGNNVLSG